MMERDFQNTFNLVFSSKEEITRLHTIKYEITRPGLFYNPIPVGWMFSMAFLLSIERFLSVQKKIKPIMFLLSLFFLFFGSNCSKQRCLHWIDRWDYYFIFLKR